MFLTSLILSLVVNALATGLIVFKIFIVYQKVKPTSKEKNLGATGGRNLLSIMFIIIESGMALFSMQLVRLVLYLMSSESAIMQGYAITLGIDQMVHVIITIRLLKLSYFTDSNIGPFVVGHNPYHHPGTGLNGIIFPRRRIHGRSYHGIALSSCFRQI